MGSVTIDLIFRKTSPFVLTVLIYFIVSILFVKWYKLTRLSNLFILSFFGIGLASLFSTLILSLYGELLNPESAISDSLHRIIYGPILLFFLIQHLNYINEKEWFLNLWIKITKIVVLIGIFQIFAVLDINPFNKWFMWENIRGAGTRIASTFYWQGPLVLFLGISLPILAASIMTSRNYKKNIIFIIFYIGGLISLLFTGSRTFLLIIPFSIAPFFLSFHKKFYKFIFVAIIIIFVLGSTTPWENTQVKRALSTEHLHDRTFVGQARLMIWQSGLHLWKDSPLVGTGPNQLYEHIRYHPHSSYLEIISETGIIGVFFFIFFMICTVWLAVGLAKYRKEYSQWVIKFSLSMGLLNFIIYNISASAINYKFMILFFALCLSYYEDLERIHIHRVINKHIFK
jgi:O-antigen ligase